MTLYLHDQRQADQHSLLVSRLRAAQVAGEWSVAEGSEAWEKTAKLWPAALAQYHSSAAKVLLWLKSEEPYMMSRCASSPTARAFFASRDSVLAPSARVRTPARRSCSPRTRRPAEPYVGAPQHLLCTARLYQWRCAAGKAPHAAYLAACCNPSEGALLLQVLEQALAKSRNAELAQLELGAPCWLPARSARACIRVKILSQDDV